MSYAPRTTQADQPSEIPQEPTGAVTSDSLAAESTEAGEKFSENKNSEPLSVRGDQSTLATTDTSAATKLDATSDSTTRQTDEDTSGLGPNERGDAGGVKYPSDATEGQKGGEGSLTNQGYVSGSNNQSKNVDEAPSYIDNVTGSNRDDSTYKPKGTGEIFEGKDLPESTKTFTGNVGGQYDPGRLAEQGFQKINAGGASSSGGVGDGSDEGVEGKGQYGVLSSERA